MRREPPATQPDECGLLDVGDGNRIYWEASGARGGKPAVVLHGGPGSGCSPWWREQLDSRAYRVVLFDQRGCGRSTPHASEPDVDLATNTTHHLITDIELLRRHLSIDRWLVLAGSWGSTLALAYGQRHPDRVTEMVLFSVTTTTRREVEWVTRDAGRFFPEPWKRFRDAVPELERDGSLVEAYHRLLFDRNPAVNDRAARAWCAWEDAHVRTRANDAPDPRYDDPTFRLGFARLVTHYWHHAAWLEDGELLRDIDRLADIPAVLIHGRLDLSSPLDIPWMLTESWAKSQLVVIDDAGHTGNLAMSAALVTAIDGFADL